MNSNETLVSKKGVRSDFLLSLQRHHQWLFIYGLFQIGVAVVISSLSWTTKEQIILPETNEVFSHPPLIVVIYCAAISKCDGLCLNRCNAWFILVSVSHY